MKWTDRKIIAAATAAFLVGVGASVVGAVVWKSVFAIATPMAAGLGAAIIILTTAD